MSLLHPPSPSMPRSGAAVEVHSQQLLRVDDSPRARRIVALLREGLDAENAGAEALAEELERFILGDGIDAVLDVLGSDLVDDQVRAAILTLNMGEIVDILVGAGIDDVWEDTAVAALPELRRLAAATLDAAGVDGAFALFDEAGLEVTLQRLEDYIDADFWRLGIVTPTAGKILDGLASSLRLERIEDVAERLRAVGYRWDHAATEARDGLAYYSNFVNDALIDEADPTGETMLSAYLGPDDKLTRPFCDVLVGKAFRQEDLDAADNGVRGRPFRHNHGGHRCRHRLVGVLNDDENLEDLGLERGTAGDIRRANAAGRRKRSGRR